MIRYGASGQLGTNHLVPRRELQLRHTAGYHRARMDGEPFTIASAFALNT